MKLSEIRQILARNSIRLSKSLGQNFLHDGNQLRRIVAAAELTASDHVLEVGPGLGPLTALLLAHAGNVLAVEVDHRLMDVLRHRFPGSCLIEGSEAGLKRRAGRSQRAETRADGIGETPRSADGGSELAGTRNPMLLLVHDDALKFLQREPRDWSDWKVVSNLPYSAASPILVELAQATGCPERMIVTVQREVAQRIVAKPGDGHYGLLTLLIQLRYEPRGWFKLPAGCFFPRPDVDSACVTLLRRSKPPLKQEQAATFRKIVKRAFSQRRKMLLKLLRADWPEDKVERAFETLGISPRERAEELSLRQFVALTETLSLTGNLSDP